MSKGYGISESVCGLCKQPFTKIRPVHVNCVDLVDETTSQAYISDPETIWGEHQQELNEQGLYE